MAKFTLGPAIEDEPNVSVDATNSFTLGPAIEEPEYEGVAQEFIEGVASGLIAIPQGILELGASAVDLAADTNYASSVTDAATKLRDYAGIDPEGLVGKGAEVITQFVIPGLGAAGAVSKVSRFSKAGRYRKALKEGKLVSKDTATTLRPAGGTSDTINKALTKGERLGLGAQQVAAAGAADAMVATDGVTTIADFFEGGPTQTNQEIGLTGREEALRRLTNKLAIGAETGLITATLPTALAGAGTVAGKVLTETPYLSDVVSGTAGAIRSGTRAIGKGLDTIEAKRALGEEQGAVANKLADISSSLRYRGFLPEEVAEARLLASSNTDAVIKQARGILTGMDKAMDKVLKEADTVSEGASPLTKQSMYTNIEEFMTSPLPKLRDRALAELPDTVANKAMEMRGLVQRLNNDVLESDYLKTLDDIYPKGGKGKSAGQAIREEVEKNINTYLRRRYQSFEVLKYQPTKEVMESSIKGFQKSPKDVLEELELIVNQSASPADAARQFGLRESASEPGKLEFVSSEITREQAERAATNFLTRNSRRGSVKSGAFLNKSRVAEYKVNPNLFTAKVNMPKFKRELLGEITDTKESFLGTVADLAEFKAVDDYFGKVRNLANAKNAAGESLNPGVASLFRNTNDMTEGQKEALKQQGFKILGAAADDSVLKPGESMFGSLTGFAVPEQIYGNLTRATLGDAGVLSNAVRDGYSGFLKMKGYTQYGKTVLSPITQIRNVTTASLFALAQGNVGRGSNLGESVRLVYNNLFEEVGSAQAQKNFQELQSLGVVGSQAELRELQDLISKGLGYGVDEINGIPVGRKFGSKLTDNRLGAFLGNTGKKFENAYQAGDDVWKIYNYDFELNKLKNAYQATVKTGDEAAVNDFMSGLSRGRGLQAGETVEQLMKEQAARIVRNTVPNYNMAPEAIKFLRRTPVGNFIAFPYEILRTGANTVAMGLDELASKNPEIRKIGLRRLSGAATTFAVLPAAMSEMAYKASGVSEEEMDAYKRSLAPEWERNARLLPTGRDPETGLPTYVNYSYSNPYDMLERLVTSALNEAEQGQRMGKGGGQIAFEAGSASLTELFSPFLNESIMTSKIRDVLDPNAEAIGLSQLAQIVGGRGGNTMTGAQVYNPEDSAGDKLAKSFAHLADGLLPAIIPVNVRSGEFEASRFARGFVNSAGLEDIGISGRDRMMRERELTGELARAFTGITEQPVETTGLKFKGYEFSSARRSANNIFTTVSNRGNATPEDFVNAYRTANEALFRVQSEFHNIVQDMRTMKMSDSQIRKVLKQANLGSKVANQMLRGKFTPMDISATVRKNVRANELKFPRQEIMKMRREFRNLPLGTAAPPEREPITVDLGPVTSVQSQPVAAGTVPPSVPAQAGAVPAPQSAPASPSQVKRDPALMGSDPFSVLKNMLTFGNN